MTSEDLPDRAIRLRARDCENCGGSDLEQLWHQFFTARTRLGKFGFEVNNVICRNCGFVFVSPVFDEADLADYYKDSFSAFAGASLDYNVGKRIAFLKNVTPIGDLFVEVGANQPTEFHSRLKSLYGRVVTVEINSSVSSDFQSLEALADGSADVVAHYFVLEHIPRVKEFLIGCFRVLRDGGVMVCEVPDISVYPIDPVALQLHEHTNHFSREILREIASQVGFAEISTSTDLCSRSFGFAVAFRKSVSSGGLSHSISGYGANRRLFMTGIATLERMWDDMEIANERLQEYEKQNASVIFWAANDLMARFLERYSLLGNVTVVDSNPDKSGFFASRSVLMPSAAAQKIRDAKAIFIFTKLHAGKILEQIGLSTRKQFEAGNVHIVDPFGNI